MGKLDRRLINDKIKRSLDRRLVKIGLDSFAPFLAPVHASEAKWDSSSSESVSLELPSPLIALFSRERGGVEGSEPPPPLAALELKALTIQSSRWSGQFWVWQCLRRGEGEGVWTGTWRKTLLVRLEDLLQ